MNSIVLLKIILQIIIIVAGAINFTVKTALIYLACD